MFEKHETYLLEICHAIWPLISCPAAACNSAWPNGAKAQIAIFLILIWCNKINIYIYTHIKCRIREQEMKEGKKYLLCTHRHFSPLTVNPPYRCRETLTSHCRAKDGHPGSHGAKTPRHSEKTMWQTPPGTRNQDRHRENNTENAMGEKKCEYSHISTPSKYSYSQSDLGKDPLHPWNPLTESPRQLWPLA